VSKRPDIDTREARAAALVNFALSKAFDPRDTFGRRLSVAERNRRRSEIEDYAAGLDTRAVAAGQE
jgi:hypothetical protein